MASFIVKSGDEVLIDDEDLHLVPKYKGRAWRIHSNGYVSARLGGMHVDQHTVYLHRLIMNAPEGVDVDHRDRNNKLDCRKSNLRFCTPSQNQGNRCKNRNNHTSRFRGVHFSSKCGKWHAYLHIRPKKGPKKGKQVKIHLGTFTTEVEAAEAFNEAALIYFGEFALLNKTS